jgi:hypothetical protein
MVARIELEARIFNDAWTRHTRGKNDRMIVLIARIDQLFRSMLGVEVHQNCYISFINFSPSLLNYSDAEITIQPTIEQNGSYL